MFLDTAIRAVRPPRWLPAWLLGASLRIRLTAWYTAVLAAMLLASGLALYVLLSRTLQSEADQAAIGTAQEIARDVQVQEERAPGQVATIQLPASASQIPGTIVQVVDARSNQILARSANLADRHWPVALGAFRAAQQGHASFQALALGGDDLRVFYQPVDAGGNVVAVVEVGRSLAPDEHLLSRLRLLIIAIAAAGLPAAAGFGWLLAGRALTPIADIARAAETIGRTRDFSQRVTHRGSPDELAHLAATINTMLAELELAHREVATANTRLERALAVQRRFVADASHELRTPLTIIRTNAEILSWMETSDSPDRARAIADLANEAERMSRMVNDLLTLARADAGQRLALQPISLRPLVEDVVHQARLLADGREVDVDTADEVEILGNADGLKQLVFILLDNAVKYTPPGGQVTLGLRRENGSATLRVADTGLGIAPEDLPRIFECFYRAANAQDIDGSGLGLAIALWIAEQHGGRIDVASAPGRGSTFTVSLPAC